MGGSSVRKCATNPCAKDPNSNPKGLNGIKKGGSSMPQKKSIDGQIDFGRQNL